jgi:single-stranded DNA-binding protein
MRGINRVIVSGNVSDDVQFVTTTGAKEQSLCIFNLASDRHAQGNVVTAWVKVNVFIEPLVAICRTRLKKGMYVIVEGELMNRGEVRARELIFIPTSKRDNEDDGTSDGGTTDES